jgi:hypothetical protein
MLPTPIGYFLLMPNAWVKSPRAEGVGLNERLGIGLGAMIGNKRIRMAMANSVLGLQMRNLLHVLLIAEGVQDLQPVADRPSVGLLYRGEVRRGTSDLFVAIHTISDCHRGLTIQ